MCRTEVKSALPVVSIQSTDPEVWLQIARRALQETSGVLVISDLEKELDWREACILGDMLLRSYMSARQHDPFDLHPGVDLEKGEAWSSSKLTVQELKFFHPHVDQGLFNVVVGARAAFRALFVQINAERFGGSPCVYDLTTGEENTLLGVVIPGYSMHAYEAKVPSPTHWVLHRDDTGRQTQLFRRRLRPDYVVAGAAIQQTLQTLQKREEVRFDWLGLAGERERESEREREGRNVVASLPRPSSVPSRLSARREDAWMWGRAVWTHANIGTAEEGRKNSIQTERQTQRERERERDSPSLPPATTPLLSVHPHSQMSICGPCECKVVLFALYPYIILQSACVHDETWQWKLILFYKRIKIKMLATVTACVSNF